MRCSRRLLRAWGGWQRRVRGPKPRLRALSGHRAGALSMTAREAVGCAAWPAAKGIDQWQEPWPTEDLMQRPGDNEGDGVIVVGRFKGDPYDGVQLSYDAGRRNLCLTPEGALRLAIFARGGGRKSYRHPVGIVPLAAMRKDRPRRAGRRGATAPAAVVAGGTGMLGARCARTLTGART